MLSQPCYVSACIHVSCIVFGTLKDNYDVSAGFFVVQFNGFMSQVSLMLRTDINTTEITYSCQF